MTHPEKTFEADAYDVIMEKISDVPHRAQLAMAARLAGQQLELLKPTVCGLTKTGMYAGPLANVRRGTILIVAGDDKGIITTHLVPRNGMRIASIANEVVTAINDEFPEVRDESADKVFAFVRAIISLYGAPPSKDRMDLPEDLGIHLFGLLMKTLDDRHQPLLPIIDKLAASDICPVLVFLSGPASSGLPDKFCSVWPIIFALAPYIQVIDD